MAAESELLNDRIARAMSEQTQPTVTLLSTLLAVQDELGYLPDEAIDAIAAKSDTTTNDVWGVASFYGNFRFTPPGDHIVEVCWGPTCHLLGAARILRSVLDQLGLSDEGETEDNSISFKYNTCLGACTQAPVMSADHRLTGRMTPESAKKLVADLRNGAA